MSYQPPSLVMRRGPQPNRPFPLDKDAITIGRSPDNDIFVDDAEVSRHHARLTRQGNNWVLEDLGSRNGTFVNGQRISGPVMLTPGAQVDFGPDVSFGVEGGMPPPSEAVPARPPPAYAPPRPGRPTWLLWTLGGAVVLVFALVVAAIAGYFFLRPSAPESIAVLEAPGVTGPDIAFQEPATGAQVDLGESVMVFATARDEKGVTRTELWVDGQFVVQQDSPDPNGVTPLSLVHYWVAATPGTHSLIVQAYNSQGAMGTSPVIYVDVSGEPPQEPTTAQYTVQPGDDPQKVAQKTGTTVTVLKKENPTMGQVITPGQIIVVVLPRPPVTAPQQAPAQAPAPPPAQPPGQAAAGPSAAPLKAPDQLQATAKDCSVALAWRDNADNEDGFGVLRAVKGTPGFSVLQPLVGKSDGTGKTLQFVDKVPRPDTYLYRVVVGTVAGARQESNPLQVKVPPTANCIQPAGYKSIFFQPRKVTAQGYSDVALYLDIFGGLLLSRRIPEGQGQNQSLKPGDDLRQHKQAMPAPASIYLNPGDPVLLLVGGEGWPGKGNSDYLGAFSQSHPQSELSPTKVWKGHGENPKTKKGFDLEYSLWLEDVAWGKGTTKKIPAPVNLRFATTAKELGNVGCKLCDPKTRTIVWDWPPPGKKKVDIGGYILYRFYSCPGKDTQSVAPMALPDPRWQWMQVPAWTVPSGCAARYQVSAFGLAGESPPSDPLDVPASAPLARVPVTFMKLTIDQKKLAQQPKGRISLYANSYFVASGELVLQSQYDLSTQFLDGKRPNNTLTLDLGEGDSLQLGFATPVCRGVDFFLPPPPDNDWKKYEKKTYTLESQDKACQVTVEIGKPAELPAGQAARLQADLGYPSGIKPDEIKEYIRLVGQDVYIILFNFGPDPLAANKVKLESYWIDPADPKKRIDEQAIERSVNISGLEIQHIKVGTVPNLKQLPEFVVTITPLDFDDPDTKNNTFRGQPQVGLPPIFR
jgi:LysM repeat protein